MTKKLSKHLKNAYIVAKEVDNILEMIYTGKFKDNNELASLFADAYLKNKTTVFWLEDEYEEKSND